MEKIIHHLTVLGEELEQLLAWSRHIESIQSLDQLADHLITLGRNLKDKINETQA